MLKRFLSYYKPHKKMMTLDMLAALMISVIGVRNYVDLKGLRSAVLYDSDKENELRCSHESPVCEMLYDEYLEAPGKAKAHSLLHTTYTPRPM